MKIETKKIKKVNNVNIEGTVSLPISEYNKLIKTINNYNQSINLNYSEYTWKDSLEMEIKMELNFKVLKDIILEKLNSDITEEQLQKFENEELNFDRYNNYTIVSKRVYTEE